jgi:hypothetical protein
MKITTVLTAVNNNPKYTKFVPFFIRQWKKLYPDIKIKIVFIGCQLPDYLKEFSDYIDLFPEISGISTVYTAQTVRIVYPAILGPDEVTVITDIDMVPGNRTYFQHEIEDNSFAIFRPLECVGKGEIAICYNAASTSVWKYMFNVNTVEDIRSYLVRKYRYTDGVHGGRGWNTDQILLFNTVTNWNGKKYIIGDFNFKRLDSFEHKYDKDKFLIMLNTEQYSDAHLYADACPWTNI